MDWFLDVGGILPNLNITFRKPENFTNSVLLHQWHSVFTIPILGQKLPQNPAALEQLQLTVEKPFHSCTQTVLSSRCHFRETREMVHLLVSECSLGSGQNQVWPVLSVNTLHSTKTWKNCSWKTLSVCQTATYKRAREGRWRVLSESVHFEQETKQNNPGKHTHGVPIFFFLFF